MTATARLSLFKVYGIVHDHVMKMLYSEEVDLQMKVCPICRHTMLQNHCMCPELEHSMKQQFVYTFRTPFLIVIGASLSEPHTSGTALQDACVCLLAAIYRKF